MLRLFGAKIGSGVRIYNSVKIYYPPNLIAGNNALIGPHVDVYCVSPITISENSMVSQYSYLCAASHDYRQPDLPLISKPILIETQAWICAGAFIGPGVTVGRRAIVGARAVVFRDVDAEMIVVGNPAKPLKHRDDDVQPN